MSARTPAVLLAALFVLCPSAALAEGEAINGFPNWAERVMHEWTNRARCDPQAEMTACGSACGDAACYKPVAPIGWDEKLNHAARFHSDEMQAQSFFAHNSNCTVVSNIDSLYPGSCKGAASCACVGGVSSCNPTCTSWSDRVALFGASAAGEIIASGTDPSGAFYQWLFEPYSKSTCGFDYGPPTNGHRYNILNAGPAVGYGAASGPSVGDFGGKASTAKLISGSHYPHQAATVDAWTNWTDTAAPTTTLIDVDGTCTAMKLERGVSTNGAYHTAVPGVGSGCHRYYFLFADSSKTVVTYPTTGSLGIGDSSCADWDSTRPAMGSGCQCTPQCSGKQCGDDGCAGSCGTCASGACQAGTCPGGQADGGAPGVDGGGADGGLDSPDGGLGDQPGSGDSGCGCDVPGSGGARSGALGAGVLVLVGGVLRSRRRRSANEVAR